MKWFYKFCVMCFGLFFLVGCNYPNVRSLQQGSASYVKEDFGFCLVSDTHFLDKGDSSVNDWFIDIRGTIARSINLLSMGTGIAPSGTRSSLEPAPTLPASVATFITGDLVNGPNPSSLNEFRKLYEQIDDNSDDFHGYKIQVPAYVGLGNHDVHNGASVEDSTMMYGYIQARVKNSNVTTGFDFYTTNYSMDFGYVHVVQLNNQVYNSNAQSIAGQVRVADLMLIDNPNTASNDSVSVPKDPTTILKYNTSSHKYYWDPAEPAMAQIGLNWLENDLAINVGNSNRPVVILQHQYAENTIPKAILDTYNIVGVFNGHVNNFSNIDNINVKEITANKLYKITAPKGGESTKKVGGVSLTDYPDNAGFLYVRLNLENKYMDVIAAHITEEDSLYYWDSADNTSPDDIYNNKNVSDNLGYPYTMDFTSMAIDFDYKTDKWSYWNPWQLYPLELKSAPAPIHIPTSTENPTGYAVFYNQKNNCLGMFFGQIPISIDTSGMLKSKPAPIAVGAEIIVFGTNVGQQLMYAVYDNDNPTNIIEWKPLGVDEFFVTAPAVVLNNAGNVLLFAVNADGLMTELELDSTDNFNIISNTKISISADKIGADPSVLRWDNNKIYLVAEGQSASSLPPSFFINVKDLTTGSWNTWRALKTNDSILSSPTVAKEIVGNKEYLAVYYTGMDRYPDYVQPYVMSSSLKVAYKEESTLAFTADMNVDYVNTIGYGTNYGVGVLSDKLDDGTVDRYTSGVFIAGNDLTRGIEGWFAYRFKSRKG